MLTPVPVARIPHEWDRIVTALKPAVDRDPKHNLDHLLRDCMSGLLRMWRVTEGDGYLVTQTDAGVFHLIYVGGVSLGLRSMKRLLEALEMIAVSRQCKEVRFEGRDWRRIASGYNASKDDDGRWQFSRVMHGAA
jgi:hypothetical protein